MTIRTGMERALRILFASPGLTAFRNREGLAAFHFRRRRRITRPGISAMLRVRNEESKIFDCLESIYGLFDEIVVVDNDSSDGTLEIVRRFARTRDPANKLEVLSYPFRVARCGAEHAATPADSLHSLVYYYNWCLARCRRRMVCKWDADMIVIPEQRDNLRRLLDDLGGRRPSMVMLSVQTVYRNREGDYFRANREINEEVRIFPNSIFIRFHKGEHWEELSADYPVPVVEFDSPCAYELKDVTEDEFAHWSSTDFATSRKQREWANFHKVAAGETCSEEFSRFDRSW